MFTIKITAVVLLLFLGAKSQRDCKYSQEGEEYKGRTFITTNNRTCQAWGSQYPHRHAYLEDNFFPDNSIEDASNYCRNPSGDEPGPWCYTTTPDIEWEYCDIEFCEVTRDCKLKDSGEDYRGTKSVTKNGRQCQYWSQYSYLVIGDRSILAENYCRNPDGSSTPYCYVSGGTKEDCDIPFCKPSMQCISGPVSSYTGTLSMTENGRRCQRWDTQSPHRHSYGNAASRFPDATVADANNYCRSPNGDSKGVWCYTTDPNVEWEYCEIPDCRGIECKSTKMGREYNGLKSTTRNGLRCQRWDSQFPHRHDRNTADRFPDATVSGAGNYCRNPDGESDGPWCYTTSNSVRWQYCGIPECTKDGTDWPRMARAKHVVQIGVDGLRPDCMTSYLGSSSNIIARLKDQGAYTLRTGRTTSQSTSAPGWSTSLCGAACESTGICENDRVPPWMGNDNGMPPVTGGRYPFPCIFETLKAQDNQLQTAAFYDWDWLANLFNNGIPNTVDTQKYCRPLFGLYATCDSSVAADAARYIQQVADGEQKSYTFVYLGNVDTIGHSFSWCSEAYRLAVTQADSDVGRILDAIDRSGHSDDFMVVLHSDHGGRGTRHGDLFVENLNVPLLFRGPGIVRKEIPTTVLTQDLAPTIAQALGVQLNPWWTGRYLETLYKQPRGGAPRSGTDTDDNTNNINTPQPPKPPTRRPPTRRPSRLTTRPPYLG